MQLGYRAIDRNGRLGEVRARDSGDESLREVISIRRRDPCGVHRNPYIGTAAAGLPRVEPARHHADDLICATVEIHV